jgi:hypothetical protein
MDEWSVSVERLDYKSKSLTYREGDRSLVLYVEMTGFFAPYDYVGGTECFAKWTTPADTPIEVSHSHLIRTRVEGWTRKHGFKVGFERPISLEEHFTDLEAKGYTREVRPDGSLMFTPGPLRGIWQRVVRFIFGGR